MVTTIYTRSRGSIRTRAAARRGGGRNVALGPRRSPSMGASTWRRPDAHRDWCEPMVRDGAGPSEWRREETDPSEGSEYEENPSEGHREEVNTSEEEDPSENEDEEDPEEEGNEDGNELPRSANLGGHEAPTETERAATPVVQEDRRPPSPDPQPGAGLAVLKEQVEWILTDKLVALETRIDYLRDDLAIAISRCTRLEKEHQLMNRPWRRKIADRWNYHRSVARKYYGKMLGHVSMWCQGQIEASAEQPSSSPHSEVQPMEEEHSD